MFSRAVLWWWCFAGLFTLGCGSRVDSPTSNSGQSLPTFQFYPCARTKAQSSLDQVQLVFAVNSWSIQSIFGNSSVYSQVTDLKSTNNATLVGLVLGFGTYEEIYGGYPEDAASAASSRGFDALVISLGGDDSFAGFWAQRNFRNKDSCAIPVFFTSLGHGHKEILNSATALNLTSDLNPEIAFVNGPVYVIFLTIPWLVVSSATVFLAVKRLRENGAPKVVNPGIFCLYLNLFEAICACKTSSYFPFLK
jgi:hypothetical protein